MAKIIAFGNQKGGTGKSTCTTLAATALSQPPFNYRVTVIDTDQQKSISRLRLYDLEDFAGVLPFDVLDYNIRTFEEKAAELDQRNDVILIDVAGKLDTNLPAEHQEASRVLNYLDFLFIPFVAGNFGLEASIDYLKFALQFAQRRKEEKRAPLQIIGFLNMYRKRTRNSRFLASEADQIRAVADIPFMSAKLGNYTAYQDADTIESLYSDQPTDPARLNFTVWIKEIDKILNQ